MESKIQGTPVPLSWKHLAPRNPRAPRAECEAWDE